MTIAHSETESRSSTAHDATFGWSWGAFVLGWLWGPFNGTWIALLGLVPPLAPVMAVILGIRGRRWAWGNRVWRDREHFMAVQRRWDNAALVVLALLGLLIAAALLGFLLFLLYCFYSAPAGFWD